VKQAQKPLNKISFFVLLIVLEITKPYKKEPIKEMIKLLSKKNLKNVAQYATNNKINKYFLFNFLKLK
tara:strand:+ start:442 stop:645 length:204 start_codon:yes stop_codon:yes gene_type:complete